MSVEPESSTEKKKNPALKPLLVIIIGLVLAVTGAVIESSGPSRIDSRQAHGVVDPIEWRAAHGLEDADSDVWIPQWRASPEFKEYSEWFDEWVTEGARLDSIAEPLEIAGLLLIAAGIIALLVLTIKKLGARMVFKKSMEPVAPPAECPECGESGAARGKVTLDQEEGEKVSAKLTGTLLLAGGIGCFALCLWFLIGALSWSGPGTLPVGVIAPVFILGTFLARSGAKKLSERPVNTVEMMYYKCRACKHEWTQEALQ